MTDKPRRWYLSACGLECGQCTIHLRTKEELDYWRSQNADLDKIRCGGCRSERVEGEHWSHDCGLVACCSDQKGLEFCAQCADLDTCALIREFAAPHEHHRAAVARLKEMRQVGVERWLAEHGYTSGKEH
jgi:hypothetical protein